jgi:hypothetical protein
VRALAFAAFALTMLLVAECAGVQPPRRETCADWFASLDEVVDHAGVRDAGTYRISGFPYLRANRFLASFRGDVRDNPVVFGVWVDRLAALDATARSYELRNLPASWLGSLGVDDRRAAIAKSVSCAAELRRADLASTPQREALVERAAVPDEYIDWHRVVGVYALATLPFSIGIYRWQEETVHRFSRDVAGEALDLMMTRYEPPDRPAAAERIAAIIARAPTDPLGIPQFRGEDRERLFEAFAPVYEIATSGVADRFGPLSWGQEPAPEVDATRPTVYRRMAFTRYGRDVLVQLVYTVWFPERPPDSAHDLLSGRLDGLMFRVTLDRRGRPLVYDTIHPCGCYHMFFPTSRVKAKPPPQPGIEWAFVPAILPTVDPGYRITLRVASGSHYLVGLRFDRGGRGTVYRFAEDDDLRALPTADGATRSAFDPDGIVPGTDRGERLLFWPTGVADTGAMRQWGKHATAFLGRRHFDDADLIERRFAIIEQ